MSLVSKLTLTATAALCLTAGVATSVSAASLSLNRAVSSASSARWNTVMLNPQPLPPRYAVGSVVSRGSWVMLNPQPLPPRYFVRTFR